MVNFETPKLITLQEAQNMNFDPKNRNDELVTYFNTSLLDAKHRREKIVMKRILDSDDEQIIYFDVSKR